MIIKKNRALYFLVDVFLAVLLLAECCFFYIYAWKGTNSGLYIPLSSYWIIHYLSIFVLILGFQLEGIINIIHNRKGFLFAGR